jgi:hypothetical protein
VPVPLNVTVTSVPASARLAATISTTVRRNRTHNRRVDFNMGFSRALRGFIAEKAMPAKNG